MSYLSINNNSTAQTAVKKAGIGAVVAGVSWATLYGICKIVKHAIKGGAKVVTEAVNEAKSSKA